MTLKLSKSSVNSFLQCRRAFKYNYIDKIPQEANEYMELGTDVHQIAEDFVKKGGIYTEDYRKTLQKLADDLDSKYDLDIHLDNLATFFEDIFQNEQMQYEVFCCEEYLYDKEHNFFIFLRFCLFFDLSKNLVNFIILFFFATF